MIITEYSGKASISFGIAGAEITFSAQAKPIEYVPLYILNDSDQLAPLDVIGDDGELTQLMVQP
jgi:hypothetical protein